MNWHRAQIDQVAPAKVSGLRFSTDEKVWNLTLDQIISNTGEVIEKKYLKVSEAGNSTYNFDEGNVLYSKLRPYLNKVICPDEPGIATTELVPLRPNPEILSRYFLAYYLRSSTFLSFANLVVAGAKMPRMIMSKFRNHEISIPSLSEQRRIVEILDQADAVRKQRAEGDTKTARILPTIFYKIFGDPAVNPKGWNLGKVDDVVLETQYGTSTRANTDEKGIPILRMNNIEYDGQLNLSKLKHIVLPSKGQIKYKLLAGDILFNRTNSKELVGKTGLWQGEMEAVAASYLIRARINTKIAYPEFIWAYMNCSFIKQMLQNKCRRAIGMANINAKELRGLPLIIPPKDIQLKFVNHFSIIHQMRIKQSLLGETIEQLFSTLLYQAFTGELTSSWRESHMNELLQEMETQSKVLGEN